MSPRREGINWRGVYPSCCSAKLGKSELCRLPRSRRKSSSGLKETFWHGNSRWKKMDKFAKWYGNQKNKRKDSLYIAQYCV